LVERKAVVGNKGRRSGGDGGLRVLPAAAAAVMKRQSEADKLTGKL
jgi:hypothetical protein